MITGILWLDILIAIGGLLAINAIGGYICYMLDKREQRENERKMVLNNIGSALQRIDKIERALGNVVKANAEPFNAHVNVQEVK